MRSELVDFKVKSDLKSDLKSDFKVKSDIKFDLKSDLKIDYEVKSDLKSDFKVKSDLIVKSDLKSDYKSISSSKYNRTYKTRGKAILTDLKTKDDKVYCKQCGATTATKNLARHYKKGDHRNKIPDVL